MSAKNTIDAMNNSILCYSLLHDVRQLSKISILVVRPYFIEVSLIKLLSCSSLEPSSHFIAHEFQSLKMFFHMERNGSNLGLGNLRSLVRIPGSPKRNLRSLKGRLWIAIVQDFLIDEDRSGPFYIDPFAASGCQLLFQFIPATFAR